MILKVEMMTFASSLMVKERIESSLSIEFLKENC